MQELIWNFKEAGFLENPFSNIPPDIEKFGGENVDLWAGSKKRLENFIKLLAASDKRGGSSSAYFVIQGNHGSGKTHLLRASTGILKNNNFAAAYIDSPNSGRQDIQWNDILIRVIERNYSYKDLEKYIDHFKKCFETEYQDKTRDVPQGEYIDGNVFKNELSKKILPNNPKFCLFINDAEENTFNNFFQNKMSTADLSSLNQKYSNDLGEGMKTDMSANQSFSNLVSCLTFFEDKMVGDETFRRARSFVIQIDESEDLGGLTAKGGYSFRNGFKNLINLNPQALTVCLCFTMSQGNDPYDLFEQGVVERFTTSMKTIADYEVEDLEKFIIDRMKLFRKDDFDKDETYPFKNRQAITLLINNHLNTYTPRDAQKACQLALDKYNTAENWPIDEEKINDLDSESDTL